MCILKENKTEWFWIFDREKRRYKATILQIIRPHLATCTQDHTRQQMMIQGHTCPASFCTTTYNSILILFEMFLSFLTGHFCFKIKYILNSQGQSNIESTNFLHWLAKTWIYLTPYVCTGRIFDSRPFMYNKFFLKKIF